MRRATFFAVLATCHLAFCSAVFSDQTILWDFETPGSLPPGWTNGWNLDDTCNTNPREFCDIQHRPWVVAAGQLRPPAYNDIDDEIMESYALSPAFKSVGSSNGSGHGSGGSELPVLSFLISYDPDKLGLSDHSNNSIQFHLTEAGTDVFSLVLDLPLEEPSKWEAVDQADGNFDHKISYEQPIQPDTGYRLRILAYDYDPDLLPFEGIGVDNIAATDAVIIPDVITIDGDFNNDGSVDAADYVVWRKSDRPVDDYQLWRANFGNTRPEVVGQSTRTAVPEPLSVVVTAIGLVAFFSAYRGRNHCRILTSSPLYLPP